jgi:hypothetical protein
VGAKKFFFYNEGRTQHASDPQNRQKRWATEATKSAEIEMLPQSNQQRKKRKNVVARLSISDTGERLESEINSAKLTDGPNSQAEAKLSASGVVVPSEERTNEQRTQPAAGERDRELGPEDSAPLTNVNRQAQIWAKN